MPDPDVPEVPKASIAGALAKTNLPDVESFKCNFGRLPRLRGNPYPRCRDKCCANPKQVLSILIGVAMILYVFSTEVLRFDSLKSKSEV